MKFAHYILVLTFIAGTAYSMTETPARKRRMSHAYHRIRDKASNHKGKVGLAVGTVGTAILLKGFEKEINDFVRPFFKKVFTKIGNFFRRVLNRKEKI